MGLKNLFFKKRKLANKLEVLDDQQKIIKILALYYNNWLSEWQDFKKKSNLENTEILTYHENEQKNINLKFLSGMLLGLEKGNRNIFEQNLINLAKNIRPTFLQTENTIYLNSDITFYTMRVGDLLKTYVKKLVELDEQRLDNYDIDLQYEQATKMLQEELGILYFDFIEIENKEYQKQNHLLLQSETISNNNDYAIINS